ncbi:3-alpha,7-alpha,12-alpha-trihydroxy-5-beta-cholest-24-enoyl-CoA hydratase [Pusillimonas sp. TS35]|uniref:MaoC/PaaZ C-terminal domain-containing protein n=1 Tax=Paracandidimonas lactea TaxID=2895524 RepID=UPI00136C7976|nr:MaoC/PaaZ C-terminal domain-containing protein [Paracandidimonas lactea]MYN13136.1 3-alpha,7-alpha,12-alpha-trihydroxy-5-beta-cholest-24-enoyl-CoA hydratase [Pusillimonas sp. TS35]
MPLDYDLIKNWHFPELRHTYTEKDVILYALGIGLGHDPIDRDQLKYVYEENLEVFPSMAAVLGYPGFWMKDPKAGISWMKLVHGEQRMHFHAPFPATGTVVGRSHISRVIDKGADKGALVVTERKVHDAVTDALLATVEHVTFCRADGGFGAGDEPTEALPKVPDRAPDAVCKLPTLAQAALLYRLSGDYNPLHADPSVAEKGGFARPILHGLCTYGVAAHALVKTVCGYDSKRLAYMHTRFSSPVYPGETLAVEIWNSDGGAVHFQARALERDVIVLSNGIAGVR